MGANENALKFKEAGNQCYKDSDNSGALENYTQAIEICEEIKDEQLLAICLKNRAAVFLKVKKSLFEYQTLKKLNLHKGRRF